MGQNMCTSRSRSEPLLAEGPDYNLLERTHSGAVLGSSWLNSSIVTCGDDNRVAVTDIGGGGEVKVFEGHERSVNCVEGETTHRGGGRHKGV